MTGGFLFQVGATDIGCQSTGVLTGGCATHSIRNQAEIRLLPVG
jgi:hypothetical protein